MADLIKYLEAYRKAATLEEKLEAAEKFARAVGPELQAFVRNETMSRSLGEEGAEEVFQVSLIAITQGLRRSRAKTTRQLWGWCYKIARHKLIDRLRKLASTKVTLMDMESLQGVLDASLHVEPISQGTADDLDYALKLLSSAKPPCFAYLWAFYILEWDYKAIAEMYDLAYDTAIRNIQRCLELAQRLAAANP